MAMKLVAETNWLWLLTDAIGSCLALSFLYRYWTDPLRSVPGPFLARFTGAWIILLDIGAPLSITSIRNMDLSCGFSPNQLCFASPEALKEIYGANSKYPKAPIYDSLGFKSVFTTRNQDDYRTMKKRIIPSFSPASTAEMEPLVHRHVAASLIKCFDKRVSIQPSG